MRDVLKQAPGFALSGALAFATDATVLAVLTRGIALDPYTARVVAIALAMVVGFFAHRRFTFASTDRPSWRQFGAFLAVASAASLVNYATYAGLLLSIDGLEPIAALVASTGVAMVFSYVGYRFGVFRQPRP